MTRLDPSQGFTAGKARNIGVEALIIVSSGWEPDFVQFIDGDCELVSGWLWVGEAPLLRTPQLVVVAARRRGHCQDASVCKARCDLEWNTPLGHARAVGDDALYGLVAFQSVGGFVPSLICGREPELCFRLARAEWEIARLDHEMTIHDAAMKRWSQWSRRAERSGSSFAEGEDRFGAIPERYGHQQARSIRLWADAIPATTLVVAALGLMLSLTVVFFWGVPAAFAAPILLTWPVMVLHVARNRHLCRGELCRLVLLYGIFTMLANLPQMQRTRVYHACKQRGETVRIIEYKDTDTVRVSRRHY